MAQTHEVPAAMDDADTPAARRERALRPLALVVVSVAVFLTALDQTVVVTALLSMIRAIGVSITQPERAAWIVSGYLLGYVVAMPLMGRVADVHGRWRVFAFCLLLFAGGSLLCALAPDLGSTIEPDTSTFGGLLLAPLYGAVQWLLGLAGQLGVDVRTPGLNVLIAARFIQAVGGGALVPVAMAVVSDAYGLTRRGLALGLVGAITEAGGVLGPVWGAWITTAWGWQWIFLLNLPLAAVLLVASYFCLPRGRRVHEPIDLLGSLLFGAALICLSIGLGQETGQPGALSLSAQVAPNPRLLLAALVLFLAFIVLELRRRWPVVDPRLFRSRAFSASALLSFLTGVALIVALVEVPLFIGSLVTPSALEAGLALLRLTALVPVGALLGGWLSSRIGCPPVAAAGSLLVAVGLWLMHLWPVQVDWTQITVATMVAGLGFGLVIAPISTSALNAVPARATGVASAVVTVLRMTGMILGLAGISVWGLQRFRDLLAAQKLPTGAGLTGGAEYERILTTALHQVYTDIFAVTAAIALLGVLPALLLWRRRQGAAHFESYVAPLA